MTLNALRQATPNRLILGIGAGKPWEPFLGNQMTEWPPLAAMRETIGLIRELMREGRGSWRGQVVDLACSQAMLREALAPPLDDLPIYIGAYGPRMTKLAGEIADGLLIGTGVRREEIPGRIAHLASGVKEVQRDMSSVDVAALVVAAVGDDGVANENTRSYVVSRVDRLTEAEALAAGFDPKRVAGIRRESRMGHSDSACKLLSREMVEAYSIQGTPSQCVSALESLVDAGVRLPILLPFGGDIHELAKAGSEYIRSA